MTGTITRHEAKQMVLDVLAFHRVPKTLWRVVGSKIEILIGNRIVRIDVRRGQTYYDLEARKREAEAAVRDLERSR